MSTAVPVAVDGGQSGIRIRVGGVPDVIESQGLGRLEGDIADGLVGRVRDALERLPHGVPRIGHMVWGLTVAPAGRDDRAALAHTLARAFAAERVDIAGDALTAHAGAFSGATGVVLTVGTGIACLGLDVATRVVHKVDGDGFLLGDAGSAFWLGSRGVEAALRAADGRGAPTILTAATRERYGTHDDLAVWLHSRPRAVSEIAHFAIDVQRAAAARDGVALDLVNAAADELTRTALAAAHGLSSGPCPLALSGRGVAEGTALHEAVLARLRGLSDSLTLVTALGSPLDGAWAIADNRLGDHYAEFLTTWRQT